MPSTSSIIITCEHAGNEVPEEYRFLFEAECEVLESHRGWDPGAYVVADFLAENLNCTLYSCHTTRLLIEPNRSLHSDQLFSPFSSKLPVLDKKRLQEEIYDSYRNLIEFEIQQLAQPVLHLSMHSFTPHWNGEERDVDIGLLFDPSRVYEAAFCNRIKNKLEELLPAHRIKFNEPYKGVDDGFTTYLRTKFLDEEYLGIEIEVNQKFVAMKEFTLIQSALLSALSSIEIL